MRPYSYTRVTKKACRCHPNERCSRTGEKAEWRSSAVVDITTALTHEELALIAAGADPDACHCDACEAERDSQFII